MAKAVQAEVEARSKVALMNQGYTGDQLVEVTVEQGIDLLVEDLCHYCRWRWSLSPFLRPETARSRWLAHDYERLATPLSPVITGWLSPA